ncbi:hypothetical protein HZS_5200 [Henneguya salminicola]|nr:hypothetical protein HZS_5200 [Henneguya salminicola]
MLLKITIRLLLTQILFVNAKILFDAEYFKQEILTHILRVRISDTSGLRMVQNFIIGKLMKLGWSVQREDFKASTPFNKALNFVNIVATHDLRAHHRIVFACHYESKYFTPNGKRVFLGAIDSAVPCAIMIHLAELITPYLNKNHNNTIQLIFFDGEESFKEWTETDSLYGSRKLAETFSKTLVEGTLDITFIEAIVNLIGYRHPTFGNFYPEVEPEFEKVCAIERSLYPNQWHQMFKCPRTQLNYYQYKVEDDHLPFVKLGVKIMHLIDFPFPPIWHTFDDNEKIIDMESIEKITLILVEFIKQNYLH